MFHPKGGVVKREMEDYVRRRHIEEGFDYVGTPHISKDGLFYTSGHLPYYAEGMFPPMEMEGASYRLKAMNCPMHNLIFRSKGRSYRELPLRLFEFGSVYRNEKSGVVHGLTRVRGMTQDDSHSYVTREQAPGEIKHLLDFCLSLFRDFGLDDYYLELSTRDDANKAKFIGDDDEWAEATAVLEQVAIESGLELVPDPGGAAYYGPKISVQTRDAIGRTWQMSTIQYDFNQPRRLRARVPGQRRLAPAPGDDPLGEVRVDRTVHRRPRRALRRCLPGMAVTGAGAGVPVADEYADYLQDVLNQLRRKGFASSWTPRTTGSPRRSATPARARCPTCSSRGRTTGPPAPSRSATATAPSATASRWSRPSRRSPRRSLLGPRSRPLPTG